MLELIVGCVIAVGVLAKVGEILIYAEYYNNKKRNEFLVKELGKAALEKIEFEQAFNDSTKNGGLLVPMKYNNKRYLLELQHRKRDRIADIFDDTKLYDPIRLIKV